MPIVVAPVLVADLLDPRGLGFAAVEGPQRGQSADDVEEVGGEERHRLPALPGARCRSRGRSARRRPARAAASGASARPRRGRATRPGSGRRRERPRRERAGGDSGRTVPRARRRRTTAAVATSALSAPSSAVGIPLQPRADEVEPELREHAGRRVGADRLEPPGRRSARDHDHERGASRGVATSASEAPSNDRAATRASSTAWASTSRAATIPSTASAPSATRAARARWRRRGSRRSHAASLRPIASRGQASGARVGSSSAPAGRPGCRARSSRAARGRRDSSRPGRAG